jgi:hypothetical protein
MLTEIQLQNDAWVRKFWRTCPQEYLVYITSHIVRPAHQNREPSATHSILLEFQQTALYREASQSHQRRLHCLIGRVVRIARGFDVERTSSGSPRRVRVKCGRHKSYTRQQPLHAMILPLHNVETEPIDLP